MSDRKVHLPEQPEAAQDSGDPIMDDDEITHFLGRLSFSFSGSERICNSQNSACTVPIMPVTFKSHINIWSMNSIKSLLFCGNEFYRLILYLGENRFNIFAA